MGRVEKTSVSPAGVVVGLESWFLIQIILRVLIQVLYLPSQSSTEIKKAIDGDSFNSCLMTPPACSGLLWCSSSILQQTQKLRRNFTELDLTELCDGWTLCTGHSSKPSLQTPKSFVGSANLL